MKYLTSIIQYLSNDLSTDSREEFEKRLQTDPELESEFRVIQQIHDFLTDRLSVDYPEDSLSREQLIAEIVAQHDLERYGSGDRSRQEKQLTEQIASIAEQEEIRNSEHAQGSKQNRHLLSPNRRNLAFWIGAAAAAVILLLVILLPVKMEPGDLYRAYYQPKDDPVLDEIAHASRSNLMPGIALFEDGEILYAKAYFKEELETNPSDPLLMLYYSICSMETNDYEEAREKLGELIASSPSSMLREAAHWYLSLSLLKLEQPEAVSKHLSLLSESGSIYRENASRLMRKMK